MPSIDVRVGVRGRVRVEVCRVVNERKKGPLRRKSVLRRLCGIEP